MSGTVATEGGSRQTRGGIRRFLERVWDQVGYSEKDEVLGDFTTSNRVIFVSALAIILGAAGAIIAKVLLWLIGIVTNLAFFLRWDSDLVQPDKSVLGPAIIIVPVIGGLIVGFMARYGSERIRGHGIPEAIESILLNGSRVDPKVTLLKPTSSAIAIGTGGPFGAEGPIIMTGGAFGSLVAQFLRLTAAERKTLLVAGAAAGMSATFAAPIASVLLAVELLLFEWKPRSMVPVALASATAAIIRYYVIGAGPVFPAAVHPGFIGPWGFLGCVFVGLIAGALSTVLTGAVYAAEDAFHKLPIHWMWWPAIGGLVVGIGGFFYPEALGVGYETIEQLLAGDVSTSVFFGVLVVKSTIWAVALGSGTSGGVLAPLLMMGGALGGIVGLILPNEGAGFWPMISMGAIMGGTMRSPFTGIVFTLELTHDLNALLPLLIATTIAHLFTVLVMKRSILTEKISRRGFHMSREYETDPLEILFVREVMRTNVEAIPQELLLNGNLEPSFIESDRGSLAQRLYPITNGSGEMVGVIPRNSLEKYLDKPPSNDDEQCLADLMLDHPLVAYPDESLRVVVYRMAETGITRFPVVSREHPRELVGMVSLHDLLFARVRNLEAERRRERALPLHFFVPLRGSRSEESQVSGGVDQRG